jgi:hypothetical protein
MIAGGKWWRANEIVICHHIRQTATRYRCRDRALAHLGRLDEAHSAVKAGLALNPAFSISRARDNWVAMSNDPTYLAQNDRIYEGLRKAGVSEQ